MTDGHRSELGRPPVADVLTLGVAVAAISTSAPLIAATATPALAISFYRCLFGSAATAPWAWMRHRDEWSRLSRLELSGAGPCTSRPGSRVCDTRQLPRQRLLFQPSRSGPH